MASVTSGLLIPGGYENAKGKRCNALDSEHFVVLGAFRHGGCWAPGEGNGPVGAARAFADRYEFDSRQSPGFRAG